MSVTKQRETIKVGRPKHPAKVVIPETPIEAQILETAADILEREGWAQGAFSAFGRRCAVGGIGAAMQRLKFMPGKKAASRRSAERAFAELIRKSDDSGRADKDEIIVWNDSGGRKKDQVVRKMREAAARLTKM